MLCRPAAIAILVAGGTQFGRAIGTLGRGR